MVNTTGGRSPEDMRLMARSTAGWADDIQRAAQELNALAARTALYAADGRMIANDDVRRLQTAMGLMGRGADGFYSDGTRSRMRYLGVANPSPSFRQGQATPQRRRDESEGARVDTHRHDGHVRAVLKPLERKRLAPWCVASANECGDVTVRVSVGVLAAHDSDEALREEYLAELMSIANSRPGLTSEPAADLTSTAFVTGYYGRGSWGSCPGSWRSLIENTTHNSFDMIRWKIVVPASMLDSLDAFCEHHCGKPLRPRAKPTATPTPAPLALPDSTPKPSPVAEPTAMAAALTRIEAEQVVSLASEPMFGALAPALRMRPHRVKELFSGGIGQALLRAALSVLVKYLPGLSPEHRSALSRELQVSAVQSLGDAMLSKILAPIKTALAPQSDGE